VVVDTVAEQPGKPDQHAVAVHRLDDAHGVGQRRPNLALVVVLGVAPADRSVQGDDVGRPGPLPDDDLEVRSEESLHHHRLPRRVKAVSPSRAPRTAAIRAGSLRSTPPNGPAPADA
jgi:hypothetical protein